MAGFQDEIRAAREAAADTAIPAEERAQMLMEIAMDLQQKPKAPELIAVAVALYREALDLCPADEALLKARITARMGAALQSVPDGDIAFLEEARTCFDDAIVVLSRSGAPEEVAEAEMNRGLVLQNLAGENRARISDSISAYQRALRTFTREAYPVEFAILQNNLATAFLSMPFSDERAKMGEALAVQCFEEGLRAVNLIDHPREYAMLQNNLGNALQYASSADAIENNLRALDAYDEALKVHGADNAPLEYANTLANKANCLWNLPDSMDGPPGANLKTARDLYAEARDIFAEHGQNEQACIVSDAIAALDRELPANDETG